MQIEHSPIAGVLLLTPTRHSDDRGFFAESWNQTTLAQAGITTPFVQDNHSLSLAAGTLRGLHCQTAPYEQAKLVRCGQGALFDVAVDIRPGSPTFGTWFGAELTALNGKQLLIPTGCLHGFVTRTPNTEVIYKCSAAYAPTHDRTIRYDDPSFDIDWGLTTRPILSDKDRDAPYLAASDLCPQVAA